MVVHLSKFIKNRISCPSGCYRVNMEEEIDKFRTKNPQQAPTIVFDLCHILGIFIKNNDEVFSGGRIDINEKRMDNFFRKLKDMQTDLVFFDDGQIKEEKMSAWLKRVNFKYEEQCTIFEDIKKCQPIYLSFESYTCFCLYHALVRTAKKYGEIFLSLHNECDLDCAAYATKINAVAVVTFDSDFLVMPGDWPIWVPNTVDLEFYTVQVWDKLALRTNLNLMQSQMPIFSTLIGNDWVNAERVVHFKKEFGKEVHQIAGFVRKYFPYGVPLSRAEFLHLVDIIYDNGRNSCSVEEATDMVDASLQYYSYDDHEIPETSPTWLKKQTEDSISNVVYSLVKDLPIFVQQTFIDLSIRDVRPYCDLALPIIRKQMGVSDYHKCRENKERIIYLKPSHEEPFQKQTITPIFPDFEIPPLNVLLGYDATEEENASLADKRLEIFCWIISTRRNRLKPDIFKTIKDKAFIVSSLVLTYLVKELQITFEEADVMLLSIYETMNASYEKLEGIRPPELYDKRGFWLAHVFLRLRQLYLDSFLLCGLNEYRQYDSYDGFIFHKMYKKYQLLDSETKRSLRKPIDDFRIYAEKNV